MQLPEHISLEELISSQVASRLNIQNTPPPVLIPRLTQLAEALEAVRTLLGVQVIISSGYRSPKLNAAVGGVPTSAHTLGWAADFIAPAFGTPLEVAQKIAASAMVFDQLIVEFTQSSGGWTHMSIDPRARKQLLTISSSVRGYEPGLH